MRLRLDLAYDGTEFHGWAAQPGLRTVEGLLEEALDRVLRTSGTRLTVAGRTDAGVHARGQVAHFEVAPEALESSRGRSPHPPAEALLHRVNAVLPPDLRVRRIAEVTDEFDARFAALWRRYAYRVADSPAVVDPLRRRHVLSWRRPLDLEVMNLAAAQLLGEHDFAAYCRRREGATTVRTLLELSWTREPDGVAIARVRADAFCHHMVRCLVGALMPVGEGRRPVSWPADVLRAGLRDGAVRKVPARGLCLEEVAYPDAGAYADRVLTTRARRD